MDVMLGRQLENDIFSKPPIDYYAVSGDNAPYIVYGTYLDSNGCMVSHDAGYGQSHIVDTVYYKPDIVNLVRHQLEYIYSDDPAITQLLKTLRYTKSYSDYLGSMSSMLAPNLNAGLLRPNSGDSPEYQAASAVLMEMVRRHTTDNGVAKDGYEPKFFTHTHDGKLYKAYTREGVTSINTDVYGNEDILDLYLKCRIEQAINMAPIYLRGIRLAPPYGWPGQVDRVLAEAWLGKLLWHSPGITERLGFTSTDDMVKSLKNDLCSILGMDEETLYSITSEWPF